MKVHERMPKELYYLSVAESVSARSTCINKHYGAIIVSKDRIVGTGYNGSPRGLPNCSDVGKCFRLEHHIPRGTQYETCLACDTVIKLLDGTYRTISDLAEENPDEIWVYAVDTKTGAVVPAKAKNIRKTGHVTEVIRVWFKDRYVDCTPDHRFLLRNGKYKPASELKPGDSIMPLYYNFANYNHESISNGPKMREEGRWSKKDSIATTLGVPTHLHVYKFIHGKVPKGRIVHHKDFDPHNNEPNNLEDLTPSQHSSIHGQTENRRKVAFGGKEGIHRGLMQMIENLKNDPAKRKARSDRSRAIMLRNWADPSWREHLHDSSSKSAKKLAKKYNSDPDIILKRRRTLIAKSINALQYRMLCGDDENTELTPENYEQMCKKYRPHNGKGKDVFVKLKTIYKYYDSFESAIEAGFHYNHKVTKIETVTRECDVYDMEVSKYHNFAVDLGDNSCVFVHNCKSIHAEANCIISATYDEMYDSTMYIYGYDCVNQKLVENPDCCMMCKRLIINSGIKEVIFADEKGIRPWSQAKYGYRVVPVRHWIDNYDPDKCDY